MAAFAAEFGYGVGYAGHYTDNILKTQTNLLEDWTNVIMAGISYRENGPQLAANLQARVEHLEYTHLDFPDETLGYVNGAAVWTVAPQRFLWTLRERLEQLPRNNIDPLAPGNREVVNVAETGPDIFIPVTPISAVVLGARVAKVWLKEGTDDHSIVTLSARWRQRLDTTSTASFNVEGSRVMYTQPAVSLPPGFQDYSRADYFLRYDRRHPTLRLIMDAGTAWIAYRDSNVEVNEPLVRINLVSRVSTESSMGISAGRELMSVGSALLAGVVDPSTGVPITTFTAVQTEAANGDVYISRRGEAFYSLKRRDLTAQASIFYRDFDYLATLQDRNETGSALRLFYNLDATTNIGAWGANQKTEYMDTVRLDRDVAYGVFLTYRLTPRLSFGAEASHVDRISSVAAADYSETRGAVRLVYSNSPLVSLGYGWSPQLSAAAGR